MRAALALIACLLCAQGSSAGELTLEALMARMAAVPGVVARFEEERTLALLAEPLVSRGTLWFAPPASMARVTREPLFSALLIDGDAMLFREGRDAEPIDLSDDPTARLFAQSFVVLWSGDLPALRRSYEIEFESDDPVWSFTLKPRSGLMARAVESIRLSGDRGSLRQIELFEKGGDRTLTRLTPVRLDQPISAEELRAAFDDAGTP